MGKNRKKVQIVVLFIALLIGGYAIFQSFIDGSNSTIKVGQAVPDFRLADLQDHPIDLTQYSGKPLVINFWGTFCEPCIREMPAFEQQYQKWNEQNVEFIGINLSEDRLTVSNYVKQLGINYTIVRDVDKIIERRYAVRSYPTTFFVNRDGTLSSVFVGEMSDEQINAHIEKIVGG